MSKIEMVREQLISNLRAELNRMNQERTWIANECEMITVLKGDIHDVSGKTRRYYRELITYRDQIEEHSAVIAADIATVQHWNLYTLRYFVSTNSAVQAWLGWN
jgi:hypothetical protein